MDNIEETKEEIINNEEEDQEYEVEQIISHTFEKNHLFYLVKWANYDHSEDSWEPEEGLYNSMDKVTEYWETVDEDLKEKIFGTQNTQKASKPPPKLNKNKRFERKNKSKPSHTKKSYDFTFDYVYTDNYVQQEPKEPEEQPRVKESKIKAALSQEKYLKHAETKSTPDAPHVLGAYKIDEDIYFACELDGKNVSISNEDMKLYYTDALLQFYEENLTISKNFDFHVHK
ncbi:hypothetical protein TVAG_268830 [Trichomonas vaginalis G3]|uniref:Chromo domain-containing protein n=1 Tax=Trichomonas vaginalis (strain ATCC PRA-98 / G3) TaxID=412133 RepID=A2FIW9_TRIV3|nr:chromobox protein family [Trichomonas vaginalis G3]EAX95146.1 hypothetical protein TVAG_268830 [Trichomonas vaginalis G3]KAI5515237.1 chromobox protein family [Trichomonas vaginalis G3]|eukprot:XP_001308076.1 hypothetical protein [Trichomonas vaginalis G3]